jgi:CRP-like cAMP-binding protein
MSNGSRPLFPFGSHPLSDKSRASPQLEALLKTIPLFHDLDEATLTCLVETGCQVEFPTHHVLCRQGDTPDWFYVILASEVRVYGTDDAGNEVTLRMMEAGAFFGELALLDRRPRSASIVCITPCQFFTLHQTALLGLLQKTRGETLAHFLSGLTALERASTGPIPKGEGVHCVNCRKKSQTC